MKTSSWLVATLILALMAIVPGSALPQEPGADNTSNVGNHMHEHLDRITTIKTSIIMGDLDSVREPAKWIAEHESVSGLPENYQPYVESMRQYAREVAAAPDLQSAATAVSNMAITCGDCHQANDVTIAVSVTAKPEEWGETDVHMQRHQWGVDRMWEGLIGPSDKPWNQGADMLVDIPLSTFDVMDASASMEDTIAIDIITQRLHALGGQGGYTKTPEERSKMFGEVLSICAECHTKLGHGPGQ
jgi:cytochrome c553